MTPTLHTEHANAKLLLRQDLKMGRRYAMYIKEGTDGFHRNLFQKSQRNLQFYKQSRSPRIKRLVLSPSGPNPQTLLAN